MRSFTLLESLPLKQGLKQSSESEFFFADFLLESLPLKQGLKHSLGQIHKGLKRTFRVTSIKTRIETQSKEQGKMKEMFF